MNKPSISDISTLLESYGQKTGEVVTWSGAPRDRISEVSSQVGIKFSDDLIRWLEIVDGLELAGVVFLGLRKIIKVMEIIPEYKEMKYLPIAGDGAGNHYVAITEKDPSNPPIGFIEGMHGRRSINSAISSTINHFIYYSILSSIDEDCGWPGDEKFVAKVDPNVLVLPYTMAWNAK